MIPRWDALLVAAIVSGGSLWIESSQRVDTGASDDVETASPASLCTAPVADRPAALDPKDQPAWLSADGDAALPGCD
jgi:hypothetical protein